MKSLDAPEACLAAALIVTAVMVFLYGRINYTNAYFREWDLVAYRSMALASPGLDLNAPRPFAYRILGPFLLGLLGGHTDGGAYTVNIAFSIVFIVLSFRFFRFLGLRPAAACLAMLLYVFNKHLFGFTTWNYFHLDDVLLNIFLIILFWSMMRRRWAIFAAALALATMSREVALLMVPVAFLYLWEEKSMGGDGKRLVSAIVPAVAIFAVLHLTIHPAGGPSLHEALSVNWVKVIMPERLYHILVNPFVPASLVPLVFIEKTIRYFKGRLYLVLFYLLVLGTTLFGANNERLLNPAFIVFYPLVGFIAQESILPARSVVALLLAGGFLSSFHWLVARYPLPKSRTDILAGGSLIIITLALGLFRIMGGDGRGRDAPRAG
jgi:hypothetical protein